jgi:CHAD domain-containing protein
MAKPREIPDLNCTASVTDAAQKILSVRWTEVREFAAATNAEPNVAGIHDLRVSTRRLRSAYRDFRPFLSGKSLRAPMKQVRTIADAVGVVRDIDVAIGRLEKHAEEAKPGMRRDGLQLLVAELRPDRNSAAEHLGPLIGEAEMIELGDRILNSAQRGSFKVSRDKSDPIDLKQAGTIIITKSYQQLETLSRGLYEPQRQRPLHRMRMGAKQLRYAMEIFSVCWGDELKELANSVSELQTALGEVHDCDVWIRSLGHRLRHFAKQQEANTSEIERAVNVASIWLLGRFTSERAKYYRDALGLWHTWMNTDLGGRLSAILGRD